MWILSSLLDAVLSFPAETLKFWAGATTAEKVGFAATGFSNVAYFPQLYRIWTTRSARDVSAGMYLFLMAGASIWLMYGIFAGKRPVVVNNVITLSLRGSVLLLKVLTDLFRGQKSIQKKPAQRRKRAA